MAQRQLLHGRRHILRSMAALAVAQVALPVRAQSGKAAATGRSITVAQIVDVSAAQQDVSKDFLIGSRAAWQTLNARGGLRGRPVNHVSLEVDGTLPSLNAALASVRDNPACVVLSGTAGDPVAGQVATLLRQEPLAIAHAAPWMQDSSADVDERTFPIFAARQEQIGHALKSLTTMGVREIGAVFGSAQDHQLYRDELVRIAAAFKLSLKTFRADAGQLSRLGQQLTPATPAVLLFIGGTPELVQFAQGLDAQQRQRYIVAMADVNLQTLVQMGGGRNTSVIATQPVPVVTSSLPVVRAYREALGRLFDEPPATLSLAGFIAARYTAEVLAEIDAPLTRPNVLAAFQRRQSLDLGGYRVSFDPRRRGGAYVTQSMLTADGRVIG